ncbi:hypothetical protein PO909_005899 [Leuciscus waleckii]
MEYRRCTPPCVRYIANDDPHSKYVKCLGFSHAREAVIGSSNCKFCENLLLKILKSWLAVFERESFVSPCRAPEASRGSATWGSDVELEDVEFEQTSPALSPSLPPHARGMPVEFSHDYLRPSPGARDAVSFGLEDVVFTEDFGPTLADEVIPPSGQEARPTRSSLTYFRALRRSSLLIGPTSPANLSRRNSSRDFSVALILGLRDRCVRSPLANAETLCLPAHQTDPGGLGQSERERSPPPPGSSVLAVSAMVFGANSSAGIFPLEDPGQGRPAVPTAGQDMASSPRYVEAVCLADQRPLALSSDLPNDVQETIASARAPSTRRLYSSKWKVSETWCLRHGA